MAFSSELEFQVWDYNVSHRQLLFRSPGSGDKPLNTDIVFWGVEYVELPTLLNGVSLLSAPEEEVERLRTRIGNDSGQSMVWALASGGRRFLVVAAGYKVLRNDLELFESSLVYADRDRPVAEYGEVLFRS